jgi:hypothetical protein
MNHPAVGRPLDVDWLRVFRVAERQQGPATARADRWLGRQFDPVLTDGQRGGIPSLGTRVPRLLAPVPLGSRGVVLGILQVLGAIVPRWDFGAWSEQIRLALAFLAFQLFDLLLPRGDAVEGLAMTRLPRSDLLTEFEVLALQAIDLGVELAHRSAQVLHQSHQLRGGVARAHGTGALRKDRSRADGTEGRIRRRRRGAESVQFRDRDPQGSEAKDGGRAIIHGGRV